MVRKKGEGKKGGEGVILRYSYLHAARRGRCPRGAEHQEINLDLPPRSKKRKRRREKASIYSQLIEGEKRRKGE